MIEIKDEVVFEIIKKARRTDNTELRVLLKTLKPIQLQHLIAMMYLGRDDFSLKEWHTALIQANIIPVDSRIEFLMTRQDLAEHLEEGLSLLGLC